MQICGRQIFECSIKGCPCVTSRTQWDNPRERWMLFVPLKDEDKEVVLNLCPRHTQEIFNLHEHDYVELERTEQMVRELPKEVPS